jgi:ribosomal protein S27AE
MPRWAGTTTQRGLGSDHQKLRKHKLATLQDGTPCRRCGHSRYHPQRCPYGPCWQCTLDLGHATDRVFGGQGPRELEHRKCNRSAGTRLRNRLYRSIPPSQRQHSRDWTGESRRKRRTCVICGNTYDANHRDQKTCGRACGLQLQRRNGTIGRGGRPKAAPKPKPTPTFTCRYCGVTFTGHPLRQVCQAPTCQAMRQRDRALPERQCEVCGATYRPSHKQQRTCGHACGRAAAAETRQSNHWRGESTKQLPDNSEINSVLALADWHRFVRVVRLNSVDHPR